MRLLTAPLAISRFLDPALLLLVALGAALFFAFRRGGPATRWAKRARVAAWAAWAGLWVLSTPIVTAYLVHWTETRPPPLDEALAGRDLGRAALVVLAGGIRTHDPAVPLRERLDGATTQRVLTGARLWHEHHFGTIVLTGSPPTETACMADLMVALGVPAEHITREPRATNTRENAAYSVEILRRRAVETVVVVTSATHLRRAQREFGRAGVEIIPAAAELTGLNPMGLDALLPSAGALSRAHVALHELLGLLRG